MTKGQRACIVINLYYEEEKQKAKLTQGTRTDISPEMEISLAGEVEGEDGELRVWYYGTTAFSIAIALFIYVMKY